MEIASFVLSVAAVVAAGLSATYARRQAVEAGRQAVEAEKVTAIEQRRFHAGLRPDIELTRKARDRAGTQAELTVELTGPAALDGSMRYESGSATTCPASPPQDRWSSKSAGMR